MGRRSRIFRGFLWNLRHIYIDGLYNSSERWRNCDRPHRFRRGERSHDTSERNSGRFGRLGNDRLCTNLRRFLQSLCRGGRVGRRRCCSIRSKSVGPEHIASSPGTFGKGKWRAEDTVFRPCWSHGSSGTGKCRSKLNYPLCIPRGVYTTHWARRSSNICSSPSWNGSWKGKHIRFWHMLKIRRGNWTLVGNNRRFLCKWRKENIHG